MSGRIVIIGAGPGGLAAAIALRRVGFDVSVHERYPTIEAAGSGLTLSTPPMIILKKLGVDVEQLGATCTLGFSRWDGHVRADFPKIPELERDFNGSFFSLLRPDLYRRLAAHVPPDALESGAHCVGFEQDDSGVTVHFEGRPSVRADLLVGADGLHSIVRRQLWGSAPPTYHGFVAWQGYCQVDGIDPTSGRIMHDRDSQVGHSPILRDGRVEFQWWHLEPVPKGTRFEGDAKAYLIRRLARWAEPVPTLVTATDPSTILRREIYDRPRLRTWSQGRVTLLGDAAHPTSPYAAYGAGMAIEDAWYLAKALHGTDLGNPTSVTRALAVYEGDREKHTAMAAGFARTLGRVFHRAGKPLQLVRDAFLDHTRIPERLLVKGYTDALRQELGTIGDLPIVRREDPAELRANGDAAPVRVTGWAS